MTLRLRSGLVWLLTAGTVAAAAPGPEWVSDTPWRSGLIYSVYDVHYGRVSPEVSRDRHATGGPLTLAGRTWRHGYGCRGFSIIELDVPAGVTAVSGVVGVDEASPPPGGGTLFSVWADGRRLWQSPVLARPDAPLRVTVPLGACRRVKLVTDAQGYGNRDLADWCDVRWQTAAPPPAPLADPAPAPDTWHVRTDLHPYHLLYRGEPLMLQVVGPRAIRARVRYAVEGTPPAGKPLVGVCEVELTARPGAVAAGAGSLTLDALPLGLYDLALYLEVDGQAVAERQVRAGLVAARPGRPPSGTIFGVNHHEFAASYEALAALGVEWSRQWFCRQWIEPRPGDWHWDWHDERLAAAREAGVQTIGVLGGIGEPEWSSPGNAPAGWQTTHGCPTDLPAWEEYVRQVATRYRGQVTVWESWNEVDYLAEPRRQGWSVERYTDLHRRTWRVLKAVDPQNRLLVCADTLAFVDRCRAAGLEREFDGLVIHPYRPGSTPESRGPLPAFGGTGDLADVFRLCREWLDARDRRDAQVWATEIGWALSGDDWPRVSVDEHARYLPRAFLLAQGSGLAANLCWHDFGLGMFGFFDGEGFPRPAALSYAGLVARLAGATPVARLPLEPPLNGFRFRRGDTDVLALWSETTDAFAELRPAADRQATVFDWFGNPTAWRLPASGRCLPVSGAVRYVEGQGLGDVAVAAADPVSVTIEPAEVVAGHSAGLRCRVAGRFGEAADLLLQVELPTAVTAPQSEVPVSVAPGQTGECSLPLAVAAAAAPGWRQVQVRLQWPSGGGTWSTAARFRVLAPATPGVAPFAVPAPAAPPVRVPVTVRNRDDQPLSGELSVQLPDGFRAEPDRFALTALAPGGQAEFATALQAQRQAHSGDDLVLRLTTAAGATAQSVRSLAPVVHDADGDGLADGWRLNPQSRVPGDNQATVAIEPGDTEFRCQRLACTRFHDGWVILHRDRLDALDKGRPYRVTFRARQEGLAGTLGVAVYHIQPWESGGLERQVRIGPDWQTFTAEFTATRDSRDVRFEFFLTETGTVWLEGMRLERVP